ncbi:NADP-dependent oxidoreductase [Ornithinimicrobium sp. W1665]|uniref:NADP-dependent oxidoreductase n=1 Tax=Ornithinimicrobium sp. W1665 TaxID=3416666 RepID=UPI003CF8D1EF
MDPATTRQVVLLSRPDDVPRAEHFEIRETPVPDLAEGQLLVRTEYLSVDPAMRGWVSAVANYAEPVGIGEVMRSLAVGEVLASRHPAHQVGDVVMGMFGWQEHAVVDATAVWLTVVDDDLPHSLALGVLGLNGLTAWAGVHRVLRPRAGSTVVVSTAAGAVGSIVGQLASRMGCRTVGIAGGPGKAARCVEEFGYDVGIDYRAADFQEQLAAATPEGVDHYFDNTSGPITDAVLARLAPRSSVLVCGTAAITSWDPWPTGPRVERIVLTRRARIEGFLAFDHLDVLEEAVGELADLVRSGRLAHREHVLDGLEHAPGAIAMLYEGSNEGKLVVRLP